MKIKDILHMEKVSTTPMNNQIERLRKVQIYLHGKTLGVKVMARKLRVGQLTTLPDQPRANSHVNDNYCLDKVRERLLAGSKKVLCSPEAARRTIDTHLVNYSVVNHALSALGHSQKKNISPVFVNCEQKELLKYVKDFFLCRSIVFCQTCNKCPSCCHKAACRGEISTFLEKLVGSGCQFESSKTPQRGLHPPLSNPAKLNKVTDH